MAQHEADGDASGESAGTSSDSTSMAQATGTAMVSQHREIAPQGSDESPGPSYRYCDLRGADFSNERTLAAWDLAGSDLRGATLPDGLSFDLVGRAENAAKQCATVFLTLMVALFACWLVRITHSDKQMALGTATVLLALHNHPVRIDYFYAISPVLIAAAFTYLHLGMQPLWESALNLPIYFPDGLRLDKKLYPWPPVRLVQSLHPVLAAKASSFSILRAGLAFFLLWVTVPLSLFAYWLHYLPAHSLMSYWHVIVLCGSVAIDAVFLDRRFSLVRESCEDGLARRTTAYRPLCPGHGELGQRQRRKRWQRATVVVAIALVLGGCTVGVISYGGAWLPSLATLNLQGQSLANANLSAKNLKGSRLQEAVLEGANLEGANLEGANLEGANLEGANLEGANLEGANLEGAKNLAQAQLNQACGDAQTKLPAGLAIKPCR